MEGKEHRRKEIREERRQEEREEHRQGSNEKKVAGKRELGVKEKKKRGDEGRQEQGEVEVSFPPPQLLSCTTSFTVWKTIAEWSLGTRLTIEAIVNIPFTMSISGLNLISYETEQSQ